jgi:hypothetical protein
MGIGVETSSFRRRAAELATGAVDDDARQDKDHADDAEQVSGVLEAQAVKPCVPTCRRVHQHIDEPGDGHQEHPTGLIAGRSPIFRSRCLGASNISMGY